MTMPVIMFGNAPKEQELLPKLAKHFYEKLGFEASHEGMKLYLRKAF
jgi:hypothetical protein